MYVFKPIQRPRIHLFGAGGTGGFALEFLTRLFAGRNVTIDVYDGDTVEEKNLKRQNFTTEDLSLSKTRALVRRLSKQVPVPPTFVEHDTYVTDAEELFLDIVSTLEDDETPILVYAVDNIATRRLLNEVYGKFKEAKLNVVALDSGNTEFGGQVTVFAPQVVELPLLGNPKMADAPTMLERFPEIDIIVDAHDENPGLVSNCAENAESKPQSMMANVRNGELLASIVFQLSNNEKLSQLVWHSDLLTHQTN